MLEIRDYTRQELIAIYNTDRIDAIKKRLSRQGYTFSAKGRGNNLIISITSLPVGNDAFKQYCIEELGFSKQTNFDKLKVFLKNCLTNNNFISLQYNEMREELEKQGITIAEETIANYCKVLNKLDWFSYSYFDCVYYVYDTSIKHNKYIDKKEYCEMYNNYWNSVKQDKSFVKAEIEIKAKYGSKPKKRLKPVLCGFYYKQYDTILKLIDEDGD